MMGTAEIAEFAGNWSVVAALFSVIIVLLYYYLTYNFDYWRKRGFPEVSIRPVPIFGHTFKVLVGRKNFTDTFDELYAAIGDKPFGGFFQGSHPCLLVKAPNLIRNILVADFPIFVDRAFQLDEISDPLEAKELFRLQGDKWKDMRAKLSSTFKSGRMKLMFPYMLECADEMLEILKKETEKGKVVLEFKELMERFTTDVIATCVFGIKCDDLKNPKTSEFRRMGKKLLEVNWRRTLAFMLLNIAPGLFSKLPLRFTLNEQSEFFRQLVKEMIASREKSWKETQGVDTATETIRSGDFIDTLVDLKNGDAKAITSSVNNLEDSSLADLNHDDLAAQAMLFFSTGFETTSSLLSLTLFELSSTQSGIEVQRRLKEEIDTVMEEDDGIITYEGVKRMHLLDRVLSETLRIYPPAGVLSRKCSKPYRIPGTRLILEKGTKVFIPVHSLQNDPKHFPNPEKFDPDRFLSEQKDKRSNYVYLPFGAGPRNCIGLRFAHMQARLGLSSLLSKFEFELCHEKTTVPLECDPSTFINEAKGGLWFSIKRRRKECRRNACIENVTRSEIDGML